MNYKTQYSKDVGSSQIDLHTEIIEIKIPGGYYIDLDKLFLIFIYKVKETRIAKIILKKQNKVGGFLLTDYRTYCPIGLQELSGELHHSYWKEKKDLL